MLSAIPRAVQLLGFLSAQLLLDFENVAGAANTEDHPDCAHTGCGRKLHPHWLDEGHMNLTWTLYREKLCVWLGWREPIRESQSALMPSLCTPSAGVACVAGGSNVFAPSGGGMPEFAGASSSY